MKFSSSLIPIAVTLLAFGVDKSEARRAQQRLGESHVAPFQFERHLASVDDCVDQAKCITVSIEPVCAETAGGVCTDDGHLCHYQICLTLDTDRNSAPLGQCAKGAGGISHVCNKPEGCNDSVQLAERWKVDPGAEGVYCQFVRPGADADFVLKDGNAGACDPGPNSGRYALPYTSGTGSYGSIDTNTITCGDLASSAVAEGNCGGGTNVQEKECLWQIKAPVDCAVCTTTTSTTPVTSTTTSTTPVTSTTTSTTPVTSTTTSTTPITSTTTSTTPVPRLALSTLTFSRLLS